MGARLPYVAGIKGDSICNCEEEEDNDDDSPFTYPKGNTKLGSTCSAMTDPYAFYFSTKEIATRWPLYIASVLPFVFWQMSQSLGLVIISGTCHILWHMPHSLAHATFSGTCHILWHMSQSQQRHAIQLYDGNTKHSTFSLSYCAVLYYIPDVLYDLRPRVEITSVRPSVT
jgi:hypothetical protein